jgi:hypothetical protein
MNESDLSLFALLLRETKATLVSNARSLEIRVSGNLRKAILIRKISNHLLNNPIWLLKRLPFQDVLKLQKMVHDKNRSVSVLPSWAKDCITRIGLTEVVSSDNSTHERISPDLAEALNPVIDEYISHVDPHSGKVWHETILNGLLNLHGVIALYEIAGLAEELCPELTAGKLLDTINRSYMLSSSQFVLGNHTYLSSWFVFDAEYTLKMTEERDSLERVHFSLKDVISAGDTELPQPPETLATRNFREELLQIVKDEVKAGWWISQFWILLNNNRHPADIIGSFLLEHRLNENEAKRFISDFLNWANHSPRWFMKGNMANTSFTGKRTSSDKQQPAALRVIPGGKFSGSNNQREEEAEGHAGNITIRPFGRKVGRNDPCPCGSGKKYKHCCGKLD